MEVWSGIWIPYSVYLNKYMQEIAGQFDTSFQLFSRMRAFFHTLTLQFSLTGFEVFAKRCINVFVWAINTVSVDAM